MEGYMVQKIRAFNRYYTTWLDVMNKDYLGTDLSWPEARVLFDIYTCQTINATELCEHLHMDKSYVSRLVGKFENAKFLTREPILGSKGIKKISLTEKGEKIAEKIDQNGNKQIIEKFKTMDIETCRRLCEAMGVIEEILRENDRKGGQKNG